jgi:hypothetical protein
MIFRFAPPSRLGTPPYKCMVTFLTQASYARGELEAPKQDLRSAMFAAWLHLSRA